MNEELKKSIKDYQDSIQKFFEASSKVLTSVIKTQELTISILKKMVENIKEVKTPNEETDFMGERKAEITQDNE